LLALSAPIRNDEIQIITTYQHLTACGASSV